MVVAAAAMAIVGAGTASATLCKVKESPCAEANQYKPPTTVLVSSPKTKLVANLTVECASHGTLVHEGENANNELVGKFTLLDWTNCSGCTEVTTTALGTFRDKATSEGNGELFPEGQVVLLKNCPFGAECTAKSIPGTTKLVLDGGTVGEKGTALGLANTTVKVEGGSLCSVSGTGTWKAETPYTVLAVNGVAGGSIFQE